MSTVETIFNTASFPISYLSSITEILPSALIGAESKKRLNDFLGLLPSSLQVLQTGFEFSLRDVDQWGDFHMSFPICSESILEFDKSLLVQDPSWKLLLDLFKEWEHTGEHLNQGIDNVVVLGFDVGSSQVWPPHPNLFLKLTEKATNPKSIIASTFLRLNRRPLPDAFFTSLESYTKGKSRLAAAGFLLARSGNIRATFNTQFSDFEALHTLFPQPHLSKTFHAFFKIIGNNPDFSRYSLGKIGIDISEEGVIQPKIGVCLKEKNFPLSKESRDFFLTSLCDRRLVNPKKKQALESWEGIQMESHTDLPGEFSEFFLKKLHHVKFVCAPDRDLCAKAYFSLECLRTYEPVTLG